MLSHLIRAWNGYDIDGVPVWLRRDGHRMHFAGRWFTRSHHISFSWLRRNLKYSFSYPKHLYGDVEEWMSANTTDLWLNLPDNNEREGWVTMRSDRDAALFKLFFSDRVKC